MMIQKGRDQYSGARGGSYLGLFEKFYHPTDLLGDWPGSVADLSFVRTSASDVTQRRHF
jgi:hypothetical protein